MTEHYNAEASQPQVPLFPNLGLSAEANRQLQAYVNDQIRLMNHASAGNSSSRASSSFVTPTTTTIVNRKALLPKPEKFNGDKTLYNAWRYQMRHKIDVDSDSLPTQDAGRIGYVLGFLSDKATSFVEHYVEHQKGQTMEEFWATMDNRFQDRQRQQRSANAWKACKQGSRPFFEWFLNTNAWKSNPVCQRPTLTCAL